MDEHVLAATAADYLAFAGDGARGRSPLYEELARRVAEDREVLAFLVALPPARVDLIDIESEGIPIGGFL